MTGWLGGPSTAERLRAEEERRQEQRLARAAGAVTPTKAGELGGTSGSPPVAPALIAEQRALYAKQPAGQAAPVPAAGGSMASRVQAQVAPTLAAAFAKIGQPIEGDATGTLYGYQDFAMETAAAVDAVEALRQMESTGKGPGFSLADLSSSDPAIKLQAVGAALAFGDKFAVDVGPLFERAGLPVPTAQQLFGGGGTGARIDTNAQDAAIWESKSRQAEFDNRMAQYDAKIAFDQTNVARTAQDISRHTQGLAESRQRADLITDLQVKTAPYNTGGRTSFSGTDMGALTESLMRKAGFNNPQAITNLVNYPSNVEIDAPGLMAAADAQLGVQGQLPQFGPMVAQPGQIPGAPPITAFVPTQYIGGSGAGQIPPYNPFPAGLPQQPPPQLAPPPRDPINPWGNPDEQYIF